MNELEPKKDEKMNKIGRYIGTAFWLIVFGCVGSITIALTIKLIMWILNI